MKTQRPKLYTKNFWFGAGLSATAMLFFLVLSLVAGKQGAFFILNVNLGRVADYFFAGITNGGDGIMWLAVLIIVVFVLKLPKAWPLLVATCVISTIITQLFKYIVLPDTPRPWKAIEDPRLFHSVPFVDVLYTSSFPSGHTATAFSIYLIFCLLLPKKRWVFIGFAYAILVGYSRVYLALHFPLDVAGGIIVAILSASAGFVIQRKAYKQAV